MKTQYYTASSLNGFIADEHNSLDWLFQFGEGEGTDYPEFIAKVGAIAMGSTTYEWILEHQVNAPSESGKRIPWPYEQPVWVFTSRALPGVTGADIRFVKGDVRPVHGDMAKVAGERNIWVMGGGELVGQFHDHGLLDEIIIWYAPVMLAGGAPLLPRRLATPPLKLISAKAHSGIFVAVTYEVQR